MAFILYGQNKPITFFVAIFDHFFDCPYLDALSIFELLLFWLFYPEDHISMIKACYDIK